MKIKQPSQNVKKLQAIEKCVTSIYYLKVREKGVPSYLQQYLSHLSDGLCDWEGGGVYREVE